jgi:predicted O-methyltransferase YrrM
MGRSLIGEDERLHAYLVASQPPEHEELRKLRERTALLPNARLQIAPEQAPFLAFLVRLVGARQVLEIGTFTGCSSLSMALALPADGRVLSCEINEEWPAIGRPYWERADVAHKIEIRIGPAKDTLAKLRSDEIGKFEFIFIDANKEEYDSYYEMALTAVRPGGLIALDNTLLGGRVAAPEDSDRLAIAIRKFNEKVACDRRVNRVMLSVGDGMTLVQPRY